MTVIKNGAAMPGHESSSQKPTVAGIISSQSLELGVKVRSGLWMWSSLCITMHNKKKDIISSNLFAAPTPASYAPAEIGVSETWTFFLPRGTLKD